MFEKFKDSVKEFSSEVKSKVTEKEISEKDLNPILEDLRLKLLKNNVSLDAAEKIQEQIKTDLVGEKVTRTKVDEKVSQSLKNVLSEILENEYDLKKNIEKADNPPVVFLMGFNGAGKTTTTAKIAKLLQEDNKKVVMGAGDTFRAASIEQLQEHGDNLDTKVISHEYKSDPAAVGYDTVEHAEKNDKIALVDTAGRSHSDKNLMQELQKMIDVNEPDISFLVVDALAGNDVINQAEAYEGMYDAIIVTKKDVDDSGGAIISIAQESGKPIAFVGTGQKYDELEEFDKQKFIQELLE